MAAFMYLHIRTADQGRELHATVTNDGALRSLGGPNSRLSETPSILIQVASFEGLSAIDERNLLDELFRRFTTKELLQRLMTRITDKELLDMLADRLKAAG